jgi:hypothetical protein
MTSIDLNEDMPFIFAQEVNDCALLSQAIILLEIWVARIMISNKQLEKAAEEEATAKVVVEESKLLSLSVRPSVRLT